MYRDTIFQYVKKQYGTIPEYLWNDLPDSAILRNDNGKWYAVFMNLEGFKIGLDTKDRVDIMVVKCKPDMISVMTHMKGFLPGYHMDKSNWITILLDGTVQEAKILDFLDMSYDLTDGRIEESIEWYLKMIKSSCEENCIKAKYIFDKVVKFIFHGSSSPFCLRCHYKAQRGILLAKIKK